nr:MAG TPA: RNA polymerase III-like protein [Caudoviricetes sp.]
MRVIKYPGQEYSVDPKEKICPCCKESRPFSVDEGRFVGVSGGVTRTESKGIFKMKIIHTRLYKCWTCGCEWEGDPY